MKLKPILYIPLLLLFCSFTGHVPFSGISPNAALHLANIAPDYFSASKAGDSIPTHADSLRGFLSPLRTCFDVRFYHLDIKIDPVKEYLSGKNTIRFTTVRAMDEMQLDLFSNMKVDSILYKGRVLNYTRDGNAVFIHFPSSLPQNETVSIDFFYSGKPIVAKHSPWDGGFTWSTDAAGNPWADVACQGTGASLWWPTKDHQSDEPDSMLISIHVPAGLKDISNGRLINTVDDGDGYTRFDWMVRNPINNYDVTVNIGKYTAFSDHFGDLTLEYYVLPEHLIAARNQFKQVKTMLACFTKLFGPYPFPEDGYKLVESTYLGMEHQSAVAYGNKFENGYLGSDLSGTGVGLLWDYIIVHESAHEWFGNNITTRDIADSWVHESFATYAESLFVECQYGYAKGQAYVIGQRKSILNMEPSVSRYGINRDPSEDIYFKGTNMLNTIRHVIGNDSVWFGILKGLNQTFRHQTVDGSQIISYISKQAGMPLDSIFKQYLQYASIPELELQYSAGGRTLQYRWKVDVAGFQMPVMLFLGREKKLIHPDNTKWTSLILPASVNRKQISVDTSSYYITVHTY